jgi:hypothetical protein
LTIVDAFSITLNEVMVVFNLPVSVFYMLVSYFLAYRGGGSFL